MSERTQIEDRYRGATAASAALMRQAARWMPGGNTRTTSFYPPYPVVIEHGRGAWLWDVDGRSYVDLFCNGLSLIHGNNYGPVHDALEKVLRRGTAWSGSSRAQIDYAQFLCERLAPLQMVRFTNSGSEACMLAAKAARHATGRKLLLKFTGAYHGSYPDLEAGLYGQGDLDGRALTAPFNDLEACERILARHSRDIAAVMIEPVLVTGRVVAPVPGFLHGLQTLARRHGALTILDDCLMLRLAVGGSCEKFGLAPDLLVLGKFLGGGTPCGAVGGTRELMSIFDPASPGCVFHGGSFNGNPLACTAGLVALRDLTAHKIAAMDAAAERLRTVLSQRAAELGLDVIVSGIGSVAGIAFRADPLRHEDNPAALGLSSLFQLACANEGLLLGPGGILAVSTAHDAAAMEHTFRGLAAALEAIARLDLIQATPSQ